MAENIISLDDFLDRLDRRTATRLTWLIGAGMSYSAGIPVAKEMSKRLILFDYFVHHGKPWDGGGPCKYGNKQDFDAFLAWYDKRPADDPHLLAYHEEALKHLHEKSDFSGITPEDPRCYSLIFGNLIKEHTHTHVFLTSLVHRAQPTNLAHLALAGLLRDQASWGHTVFTTNFDDLLLKALLTLNHTARVFGELESQDRPLLKPTYPQIVHLHGRHTGYRLANTTEEFQDINRSLREAFRNHLGESQLIVLGYSGWDDVAMGVLREWHRDGHMLDTLYWVPHRSDATLSEQTREFLRQCPPRRAHIVVDRKTPLDADSFMLALCKTLSKPHGFASYRRGIIEQAKRQHDFTLAQLKEHPVHDPLQSGTLARSAATLFVNGDSAKAREVLAEAKGRADSDLPETTLADVFHAVGVSEMMLGDWMEAHKSLSKAQTLLGADDETGEISASKVHTILALGFANMRMGSIREAANSFHDAKRQALRENDFYAWSTALLGLAFLAIRRGDSNDALYHLACVEQSELFPGRRFSELPAAIRAEVFRLRGDCYRAQFNKEEAKEDYIRARELYENRKDVIGVATIKKRLGDLLAQESPTEARMHYDSAADDFRRYGDELGVATVEQARGDLWFQDDELERAAESYWVAHNLYEKHEFKHALCNVKADILRCAAESEKQGVVQKIEDRGLFVDETKRLARWTDNKYAWDALVDLKYVNPRTERRAPAHDKEQPKEQPAVR